MIKPSANYIMAEIRRTDIALRQHCEDTLLALPGKSKLLLESFQIGTEKKALVTSIATYQMPGIVQICFSKGTTETTAVFGITT